jgi:hypothetical protein
MAEGTGELTVSQRLGQLLDRGLLPAGGPAEAAERLIERLDRPARIAILGLPGAGKSAILNLLAGSIVVPETLRLPTIVVQYGPEARMICTLSDGRTKVAAGGDLGKALELAPALVTLELDLPSLKVISLLEVSAGPMEAEQRRAAIWASKRADIVIWCTTSYLPKEQVVWDSMPDVVKDNGFLFLTKVDLLGSREAAQGMLERVEQRAGEDFRQVFSISAKQARAAMPVDGPVDRDMFRDSGATAVISTIKSRVQMARRADTDMAELLLARHVEVSSMVTKHIAEVEVEVPVTPKATREWAPPPDDDAIAAAVPETDIRVVAELINDVVAEPVVEPLADLEPTVQAMLDAISAAPPVIENTSTPVEEPAIVPLAESLAPIESKTEAAPKSAPKAVVEAIPERDGAALRGGVSTGAKRFADRIKAAPVPEDVAPQVPLRTTWKSRAETQSPVAKPAEVEPEVDKPVVARAGKDRPQRETGTPRAPVVAKPGERPTGPQLFGARRPPVEPLADLSALRPRLSDPAPEETEAELHADASPQEEPVAVGEGLPEIETAAEIAPVIEPVAVAEPEPEVAPEPAVPDPPVKKPAVAEVDKPDLYDPELPEDEMPAARAPTLRPVVGIGLRARLREPFDRSPAPSADAPVVSARFTGTPRERVTVGAAPAPTARVAVLRERRPEPLAEDRTERRDRPRITPRPDATPPAAMAPVPVSGAEQAMLDAATAIIIARSEALASQIDPEAKLPVDLVLQHARETTEQAIEVLSQGSSAELRRIASDLGEVLDLILLMQLEKGHAPADDALTLLLQLRRDLETLRAA